MRSASWLWRDSSTWSGPAIADDEIIVICTVDAETGDLLIAHIFKGETVVLPKGVGEDENCPDAVKALKGAGCTESFLNTLDLGFLNTLDPGLRSSGVKTGSDTDRFRLAFAVSCPEP